MLGLVGKVVVNSKDIKQTERLQEWLDDFSEIVRQRVNKHLRLNGKVKRLRLMLLETLEKELASEKFLVYLQAIYKKSQRLC